MKCRDIDIIGYLEGRASKDCKLHIETCKKCSEELDKLQQFSKLISTNYSKGKKLDEELTQKLQNIDISKMKKLPDSVVKKIADLRDMSLMSKLTKSFGKHQKDVKALVEGLLSPRMQAMPASPKGITKAKRAKRKKKAQ